MHAGGDARKWRVAAFALALMLALAVWKPWGSGGVETAKVIATATPDEPIVSHNRASPSVVPPATPTPTPTPHPDAIACISATGWRAVTRDVTGGRESRTWIAVDPAAAAGPQDEALPTVRIVVGRLIAIGYCVPAEIYDDRREERLWRVELIGSNPSAPRPRPSATPIPVSPLQTLAPRAPGFADMFGPPEGARRWAAGRYVFAIDLGADGGQVWFSIEVVDSVAVPDQRTNAALVASRVSPREAFQP